MNRVSLRQIIARINTDEKLLSSGRYKEHEDLLKCRIARNKDLLVACVINNADNVAFNSAYC